MFHGVFVNENNQPRPLAVGMVMLAAMTIYVFRQQPMRQKLTAYALTFDRAILSRDLATPKDTPLFQRPDESPFADGTKADGERVPSRTREITITYVRHGNSYGNAMKSFCFSCFRRSGGTVLDMFSHEFRSIFNPTDSAVCDFPLSKKGVTEAAALASYFEDPKNADTLGFNPRSSAYVVSDMRRAVETALIGVSPSVNAPGTFDSCEPTDSEGSKKSVNPVVLTDLRETHSTSLVRSLGDSLMDGVNVRTHADPGLTKRLPFVSATQMGPQSKLQGEPPLTFSNRKQQPTIRERQDGFLRSIFGVSSNASHNVVPAAHPLEGEDDVVVARNAALRHVVVVGHSSWLRIFCQRFMSSTSTHAGRSKNYQLKNCGVVRFTVRMSEYDPTVVAHGVHVTEGEEAAVVVTSMERRFEIVEGSLEPLYMGWSLR